MLTLICLNIVIFAIIVANFSDGKFKILSILEGNLNTEEKCPVQEIFYDDMLTIMLTNG